LKRVRKKRFWERRERRERRAYISFVELSLAGRHIEDLDVEFVHIGFWRV
jgi:hypothetical protein